MSCTTDFSLLCTNTSSSNCVIWEGENIPCLGITKGMALTPLLKLIADKICEIFVDIDVSTVVVTGELVALLGTKDKSIANLFQILLDYGVDLRTLITGLEQALEVNNNIVVDYKCLSTHTGTTSIEIAIQTLIDYCCYLNTTLSNTISNISTTVYNQVGSALTGAFSANQSRRVEPNGLTGSNFKVKFWGFVPPFTPLPYYGGLSVFDNSGKGIAGTFMERWYICNGNYGTPDLRGRTIVGAVNGTGGSALHSEVDPNQNGGLGNYYQWTAGGQIRVRLTLDQIPSHKHNVYDAGHSHEYQDTYVTPTNGGPIEGGWASNHTKSYTYIQGSTENSNANIQESSVGGDGHHDTRMPFSAAVWIMLID